MPSIKEVAQRAGVSVATVSRVLNQNPNVKPRLRQRVMEAIKELDYHPSGIARNMRNQVTQVIGLIITDIQNPFFTSLVRAVEDVAYEHHYTVLLCNSDEDPEKEKLYISVLSRERVSGVIMVPTSSESYKLLLKFNVPLVMADRTVADLAVDSVALDNEAGAYQATRYLIELGHRNIGLVSAPLYVSVGYERMQGYRKAMCEFGLPVTENLIQQGDFKEEGGYRAAQKLLRTNPSLTAMFIVNNLMTIGALRAIREAGLNIPSDISVIGFDDMPWLPLLVPPLTAVRQPTYEIGAAAARLLFSRLEGDLEGPPQKVVLQPELIVRGSTSPAKK